MSTFLFQTDPNTAFLRAARAGQLDKIIEYLDSGTVRDINTSNAVSNLITTYMLMHNNVQESLPHIKNNHHTTQLLDINDL